jgi:hypothetical protein
MKKIVMLATIVSLSFTGAIAQSDTTRSKSQINSTDYTKQKQQTKPETGVKQKESGTQTSTGTVQGKSGTQGEVSNDNKTKPVSGTKQQNESGVQGETGTISGKSGTQGQTTQGETSGTLEEAATTETATPTESPNLRDTQYRNEDKIRINNDEVPSGLRKTLSGAKYKGWENSSLYHDKNKNEYILEMQNETQQQHRYYFDKDGNVLQRLDGEKK